MEAAAFRFAISATFTAEPLEPVLRFWESSLETPFDVRFAPYDQVHQTLAQFASEFAVNRHGVNVVLARVEDLAGFDWNDAATFTQLQDNFTGLLRQLRNAPESYNVPVIFMLCPPTPGFLADPARALLADQLEAQAQTQLAGAAGLHYLRQTEVARLYPVAAPHSPEGERLGRIPYTELYFCALGTALVRLADALFRPPFKVIALDCDNTLWQGICGEDGPAGVLPTRALQQFMLSQRNAGMLLAMASKNNEQDVFDTFAYHSQMPLQLSHFAAWKLNWSSKAENLKQLATELSLGADSFVFVDDNARETAEVEEAVPEVLSLTLPETEVEQYLHHVWAFDHWSVTEEDRQRNVSVAGAREFGHQLKSAENLQHFMGSLNLRLTFGQSTPDRLPRLAQLTQRTNQFNFTTIRRTEVELARALSSGLHSLTVEVADRFGDYGLTGLVLYRVAANTLAIDTFLLSCRVLGRGVEHRVLSQLATEAASHGANTVTAAFVPTAKNQPAQQFLQSVGGTPGPAGTYRWGTAALAALRWAPEAMAEPEPVAAPVPILHRRPDYQKIATQLNTVERIRDAMASAASAPVAFDPAFTSTEQRLAALWASLLGLVTVPATGNFFDLGGHSLLMVRMVMRVRETFHVDLAVDDVYSATLTLRDLARKIDGNDPPQPADYDALLSEIEAMSDEEVERLLREEQREEQPNA